jgi:hypothetical protein
MVSSYDRFVVFCNSHSEQASYEEILPTTTEYYFGYKEKVITRIYEMNRKLERAGKRKANICCVFDDVVGEKVKREDTILQVFSNGRHAGISCLFIAQSMALANRTWRINSDVFFCLKQNSSDARRQLIKEVFSGSVEIPDGLREQAVLTEVMKKHMNKTGDVLVLDNRDATFDNLYWYRAP